MARRAATAAGLLHIPQHRVEKHDAEDGDRFIRQRRLALVEPQRGGDCSSDQQQNHQDVGKLREELFPGGDGLFRRQLVMAVFLQPRLRLGLCQAEMLIGA
jgi:hypothetical protein